MVIVTTGRTPCMPQHAVSQTHVLVAGHDHVVEKCKSKAGKFYEGRWQRETIGRCLKLVI